MQWQRGIYDGGGLTRFSGVIMISHGSVAFGDDTSEEMRIQSAKMLAIALTCRKHVIYLPKGKKLV